MKPWTTPIWSARFWVARQSIDLHKAGSHPLIAQLDPEICIQKNRPISWQECQTDRARRARQFCSTKTSTLETFSPPPQVSRPVEWGIGAQLYIYFSSMMNPFE